MSDLLARLQAAGSLESRGEFTLDVKQAQAKLGHFQLGEPDRFFSQLVAVAHAQGLPRLEATRDAQGLVVRLPGLRLPRELPQRLVDWLLDASSPWRRLAAALNALLQLQARAVVLYGTRGESWDVRSEVVRGWDAEVELDRLVVQGPRLNLEGVRPAVAHARIPVLMDGEDWRAQEPDFPYGSLRLGPLLVGLHPTLAKTELTLVYQGVVAGRKAPDLGLPLRALAWADEGWTLDASLADVVEDPAYHALLSELAKAIPTLWERLELLPAAAWTPALRELCLAHLGEHPTLDRLPLFPSFEGGNASLEELRQRAPVLYLRERLQGLGPNPDVVDARDKGVWKALERALGKLAQDGRQQLAGELAARAARARFLAQPVGEPRLREAGLLTTIPVSGDGYRGELGIQPERFEATLEVLLQGRLLSRVQVSTPFPFLAVLDFDELEVDERWASCRSTPAFDAAVNGLRKQAEELFTELGRERSQDSALRPHLLRLLGNKNRQRHSVFGNARIFLDVSGQAHSLRELETRLEAGASVAVLPAPTGLPDFVPPHLLSHDVTLVAEPGEMQMYAEVFGKKSLSLLSEGARDQLQSRAARYRPRLAQLPEDLRTPLSARFRGGELAFQPASGTGRIVVLHRGIEVAVVERETALGFEAVVECPDLTPHANWKGFPPDDPDWKRAGSEVERALAELPALLELHLSTLLGQPVWRTALARHLLDNRESYRSKALERAPLFPALPRAQSLAELEAAPRAPYLEGEPPESLAGLDTPFLLHGLSGKALQALRGVLTERLVDWSGQWRELRNLSDYLKQPTLPVEVPDSSALVRFSSSGLEGVVGVGPAFQGDVQPIYRERALGPAVTLLPRGCRARLASPDWTRQDFRSVTQDDRFRHFLDLLHEATGQALTAWCRSTKDPPPVGLLLGWLERAAPWMDTDTMRAVSVLPSNQGTISIQQWIDRSNKGRLAYVTSTQNWDKAGERCLVLVADTHLRARLEKVLKLSLIDAGGWLSDRIRHQETRKRLRGSLRKLPRCWESSPEPVHDLPARLGIPRDGSRLLLWLNEDGEPFGSVAFGYALSGTLQGSGELSREQRTALFQRAGELYARLAGHASLSVEQRLALTGFLLESLPYLGGEAEWARQLVQARWIRAYRGARVSLAQLKEEGRKGRTLVYLARDGAPAAQPEGLLPILSLPEERLTVQRFLRCKLVAAPERDLTQSLREGVVQTVGGVGTAFQKVGKAVVRAGGGVTGWLQRMGQSFLDVLPQSAAEEKPVPAEPAARKQGAVLTALRREAHLLLAGPSRHLILAQLERMTLERYVFGPACWWDLEGGLRLNSTHALVRRVEQRMDADRGAVLVLLVAVIGLINHHSKPITDAHELDFLTRLEESLLESYPDGPS